MGRRPGTVPGTTLWPRSNVAAVFIPPGDMVPESCCENLNYVPNVGQPGVIKAPIPTSELSVIREESALADSAAIDWPA